MALSPKKSFGFDRSTMSGNLAFHRGSKDTESGERTRSVRGSAHADLKRIGHRPNQLEATQPCLPNSRRERPQRIARWLDSSAGIESCAGLPEPKTLGVSQTSTQPENRAHASLANHPGIKHPDGDRAKSSNVVIEGDPGQPSRSPVPRSIGASYSHGIDDHAGDGSTREEVRELNELG